MATNHLEPTYEYKVFVPRGFSKNPPATAKEALQRTRALLRDEERWIRNNWYWIQRPEEDPENPFCDDWKVCLDGALLAVTVGVHRQLTRINVRWEKETDSDTGWDNGRYVEVLEDIPVSERKWEIEPGPLTGTQRTKPWPIINKARKLLVKAANASNPDRFEDVPGFNDSVLTTRTNVMAVLNKAIKMAK